MAGNSLADDRTQLGVVCSLSVVILIKLIFPNAYSCFDGVLDSLAATSDLTKLLLVLSSSIPICLWVFGVPFIPKLPKKSQESSTSSSTTSSPASTSSLLSSAHLPHVSSSPALVGADGAIVTSLLPPLSQPVPASWKSVEGEFIFIWACNMPWMSSDAFVAPEAQFNDGCHDVVIVTSPVSKVELSEIMLGLDNGTHIQHPKVRCVKARAWRLEPVQSTGYLCIDGESVPLGPMQCQVMPGLANIMCRTI
eukprot:GILI01013276.1.p1 GENE.GILI01013276.1~~GILI01013276.1.p1  ORF type:complete len:251 (+),score=58.90 GILI01013276.1:83-835(+)